MKLSSFTLLLLLLYSCCPRIKIEGSFSGKDVGGWYIPVQINGKNYNFLFDTGCSRSYISEQIVKELNLSAIDSVTAFVGESRVITQHYGVGNIHFSINGVECSNTFLIYPTNEACILGMDFIKKYYWEFNQKDHSFIMSDHPIELQKQAHDKSLEIKYRYAKFDTPLVDLQINDTIFVTLKFDTGLSYGFVVTEDSSIMVTPIMNITHYDRDNYFAKYVYYLFEKDVILPGNSYSYYIPANLMKIETMPPSNFFIEVTIDSIYREVRDDGTIGLLGLHFVRQFRTMYIDPVKQEFIFSVSPEDSSFIYKGEDVNRVKALREQARFKKQKLHTK